MSDRLQGKTALVTGGARGIGAAIARRLAAEGARIVITYASNEAAARATVDAIKAGGGTAEAIRADAADPAAVRVSIERAVTTLGGLDILVHNAGTFEAETIEAATEESFRRQFGINVDGVFVGTQAAVGSIRDGGRIIIISSVNAHSVPVPGSAVYGATKAAVSALARGWGRDLGSRGILVNAVQPGPIDTDLNPADGDFAKLLTPNIALGRYGRSEEVAALVAFLASDEASFITGASIDIDGGLTL